MMDYLKTAVEIEESGIDTAILPVGSLEQHGSHLPVATDIILAEAMCKEISKDLNYFLLPTLPISTCYEHRGRKGSVWMKPDTFYYVIRDIVLSLRSQGFKKIVIFIGHGGIFVAGPIIRELNALYEDITVIQTGVFQFGASEKEQGILENKNDLHAGEAETSLMLYLQEELVNMDQVHDCVPDVPRGYLNYASLFKYSPHGIWGKGSLATKEKGEKVFKYRVEETIRYIKETFNYLETIK